MPSKLNPVMANGGARRRLRARVLARDTTCALCGEPLPAPGSVSHLDPRAPEVDEDLPRSRGGSPLDPMNCVGMHRACNQWKGELTLREARELLARGASLSQRPSRRARRAMLSPDVGQWEAAAARWLT